jgi:hypothetical protein
MARHEADREDLLREATALIERVELQIDGETDFVVIGFRPDGAASVFFGASPVLQFNRVGQLRRGFANGQLIKAEQGRLIALNRQRSSTAVNLVRHAMSEAEQAEFLSAARERLNHLQQRLLTRQFRILGQIPRDGAILPRVLTWLDGLPDEIAIARVPNAGAEAARKEG